ncbi:UV DNA damage repair endonuclease UvsE [Candidatus Woesearchaeota archaeon]|nr:UV DNA damage repair endonuclease UvsE [Candidatus Woesearchaeota archaeon]
MRIGYPCINRSIGCTANSTFRLKNYSKDLAIKKAKGNIECLKKILDYNLKNRLLFFRISSDIIPFASHPVFRFDWKPYLKKSLKEIGRFIKSSRMRISMHPDQFILLNSPKKDVVRRSIRELRYHCRILDVMGLDSSAKVQVHVGGIYGDKRKAVMRFIRSYRKLPIMIRKRLVIENDDRLYSLKDCLEISKKTGIPAVFDSFHHQCLNEGEPIREAMIAAQKTWKRKDGPMIVHYSSQKKGARAGSHAEHIDINLFRKFIRDTKGLDFDLMLEIKDKEKSALEAIGLLKAHTAMT